MEIMHDFSWADFSVGQNLSGFTCDQFFKSKMKITCINAFPNNKKGLHGSTEKCPLVTAGYKST